MIIEDEVLILKEIEYKENDKILHALSKYNGKIQLLSKGCRKNNSHLIKISQIFAYCKCTLYKSKDMYIITYAELINNFYNLRTNIDAFLNANYILELISYVAQDNEVDTKIFDMTVEVLKCLSNSKDKFEILTAAYELKLVSMLGYKPELKKCNSCGVKIRDTAVFSIDDGGIYCLNCVNNGIGINMTYNEILTMERILKTKFGDIKSLENVNSKILSSIRKYLFFYIGKDNFTTLKLF